MIRNLGTFGVLTAIGLVVLVGGCPVVPDDSCLGVVCDDGEFCNGEETCVDGACVAGSAPCEEGETCDEDSDQCVAGSDGLDEANAVRGGSLYDKWWVVVGADEPTGDHPFWATQSTNERTGADTWRCKECHGWDYKGVDGAYASGSHMTGFAGIFGTTLSAQEVFDTIKDDHGLGAAGLGDADIWDLAKFVLEGLIDTDDIIDADNAFTGDVDAGQVLYDDGIGTNMACAVCHGADGMTIEFHDDEFLGELAVDNPWEFQHKVRFGNPGTGMPAAVDVGATNDDVAAVGAYSQTLAAPADPEGFTDADAAVGGALYDKWWVVVGADAPTDDFARWAMRPDTESNSRTGADTWRCKECHGWDYKGVDGAYGSGSHRTGFGGIFGTTKSAQELFDTIDGHGFGDSGLVEGDIWDLAKFVLEGLIDTDDIIDADNAFTGDVDAGQVLYDDGIGTNMACAVCHGADGMTIEFHDDEFLGELAVDNPWEFQHKVRFGNPGTAMPAAVDVGATNDDVAAVGAYSQTLATGP